MLTAHAHRHGLQWKASKSADFAWVRTHEVTRLEADSGRATVLHLGVRVRRDGQTVLSRKKMRAATRFLLSRLRSAARIAPSGTSVDERLAMLILTCRRMFSDRALTHRSPLRVSLSAIEDDKQLAELDRWVALTVLRLALRGPHRRSLFRRVSFERLRALGLPSLVHLRRTGGLR